MITRDDVPKLRSNDPRTAISDDPHTETADESTLAAIPDYPLAALPASARELIMYSRESGLPVALVAGAALAALAAATGAAAEIEVVPAWRERAILWIPLLAPRGAGKSPAQTLTLGPLREHDAALALSADEGDAETTILIGEMTLEALARSLAERAGPAAIDLDELAVLLRGLGEYKHGGGGDRGRLLALWSGAPWSYTRVGSGGKRNAVRLQIARPTLVICGGLQPALHDLLGGEEDGLRPRWLPHLAEMPVGTGRLGSGHVPSTWADHLSELIEARHKPRTWHLDDRAHTAFELCRTTWKRQARNVETASTAAALAKADVHLARVALVLAEAEQPAAGTKITAELIERAARIIEYVLGCWRALPEQGTLALSHRDQTLDRTIPRLVAWLEERGGSASRRELLRAHVAGVRTSADLDALLERYAAIYPGAVGSRRPKNGGPTAEVIKAPVRRAPMSLSPPGDSDTYSDAIPQHQANSCHVTLGANANGDSTHPLVERVLCEAQRGTR